MKEEDYCGDCDNHPETKDRCTRYKLCISLMEAYDTFIVGEVERDGKKYLQYKRARK